MESIKILREICQASRKETDNWHMKHISRKPSIYITWLLLHTPITANGATLLFLLTGFIAASVFIIGGKWAFLTGSILLEFWYIMDMVDGEIARYKKQTSLTGVYFDCMSHYIIHPLIFMCVGLGLYKYYHQINLLVISIIAGYSICMISVTTDVFNAVFFQKLSKCLKQNFKDNSLNTTSANIAIAQASIPKKLFSLLHLLCTFPSIMNAILIFSIVNLFTKNNPVISLIKFYAVSATLVWIIRLIVFIKTRKIETELAKT